MAQKIIKITCYNKTTEWKSRSEAKKFYLDCMANSEGSERDRYTDIYLQLYEGLTNIHD